MRLLTVLHILAIRRLDLGQGDVFLQKIPISFDPSVQVHICIFTFSPCY